MPGKRIKLARWYAALVLLACINFMLYFPSPVTDSRIYITIITIILTVLHADWFWWWLVEMVEGASKIGKIDPKEEALKKQAHMTQGQRAIARRKGAAT
jgi:hypothetical protein